MSPHLTTIRPLPASIFSPHGENEVCRQRCLFRSTWIGTPLTGRKCCRGFSLSVLPATYTYEGRPSSFLHTFLSHAFPPHFTDGHIYSHPAFLLAHYIQESFTGSLGPASASPPPRSALLQAREREGGREEEPGQPVMWGRLLWGMCGRWWGKGRPQLSGWEGVFLYLGNGKGPSVWEAQTSFPVPWGSKMCKHHVQGVCLFSLVTVLSCRHRIMALSGQGTTHTTMLMKCHHWGQA